MNIPLRILKGSRLTGLVMQLVVVAGIIYLGYLLFRNTQANLEARNIASGFGFFSVEAGFPISNALLPYTPANTYGYAFFIGILNTLYVALLGIIATTFIGIFIGVARVSSNWLVAKLAEIYVETLRNIPLLLVLFFTYSVVLATLPGPRASLNPFFGCFINDNGLSGLDDLVDGTKFRMKAESLDLLRGLLDFGRYSLEYQFPPLLIKKGYGNNFHIKQHFHFIADVLEQLFKIRIRGKRGADPEESFTVPGHPFFLGNVP